MHQYILVLICISLMASHVFKLDSQNKRQLKNWVAQMNKQFSEEVQKATKIPEKNVELILVCGEK